ncbi:MAG: hypothetical protein RLZZ205_1026 [Bacteroidota bacterium]
MKPFILFLSIALVVTSLSTGCLRSGRLPRNEAKHAPQPMERYLQPSTDLHDTLLLYKKTPCFGACPTFTLVVKMDGEVYYNGRQNVAQLGDFKSEWSVDILKAMEDKMAALHFYDLPTKFDNPQVTDLPSMYLGYTKGNHLHTIKCRYQTPQDLKNLALWLDGEIEKTKWNLINPNNNHE